jgi:MtN3 and saliva related transmembrane protein
MLSHLLWLCELMFTASMFANAVLFIPQALKVYRTKNASGLSLTTFIGFNIIQIFTILHGYIHKDYPLMFGFILSFIFCGVVTFLIFIYRKST